MYLGDAFTAGFGGDAIPVVVVGVAERGGGSFGGQSDGAEVVMVDCALNVGGLDLERERVGHELFHIKPVGAVDEDLEKGAAEEPLPRWGGPEIRESLGELPGCTKNEEAEDVMAIFAAEIYGCDGT